MEGHHLPARRWGSTHPCAGCARGARLCVRSWKVAEATEILTSLTVDVRLSVMRSKNASTMSLDSRLFKPELARTTAPTAPPWSASAPRFRRQERRGLNRLSLFMVLRRTPCSAAAAGADAGFAALAVTAACMALLDAAHRSAWRSSLLQRRCAMRGCFSPAAQVGRRLARAWRDRRRTIRAHFAAMGSH
jgi:hypothetical protein